ncbi:MAG: hypothetical protein IKV54_01260, partial [Clostridia bacterium]|nr:hypothetical protein [Clostridia bacterium]
MEINMAFTKDNPWIAQREATICTWKTDYNRGYMSNLSASLLTDFACMSDRQLADYAKMLKACGFNGAQVTDIAAAWRASGSWEFVHDRYKVFANELHKLGMKFTLWVWAAKFTGHGWVDDEVVYENEDPTQHPYKDPRVRATFNKYYDIYADMAPYTDRVIAHFFDPGEIGDIESILFFTQLLAEKFRAINPNIKIGIDTWGAPPEYPSELVKAGMKDIMLMELPFLPTWREEGKRARFREGVKALGAELGAWGWYTCDYEVDQVAKMTVNNRVISHVFSETRKQGDHVMAPSYWSELDSYHLINFFSMYAAGHLMIDPEADPDVLLRESAQLMAGNENPENVDRLMRVLEVIRDSRSGSTWESYWSSESEYTLVHADFAPILTRAETAIEDIEYLIGQPEPKDGVAFPITRKSLYRLIRPHLWQIRQYARFRIDFDAIKALSEAGADNEVLQEKINALDFEVPEYNCTIGLWGQNEARAAYWLMTSFCGEKGLTAPPRSDTVKYIYKRRMMDMFIVRQRGLNLPYLLEYTTYESGYAYSSSFA